ncbi:UNVERIFIED_CONTAM: Secologanin synthase [Sesamum calycinum]|uniref:Secologanin synthase n=1 Tax=Sesamum calycinum TaxID=2727403 RepID=A0AAW2R9M8_9LAMI
MWKFALIPVFSLLVVWTWQFLNWAWLKPRKTEKLFRQQGMKGNPYTFLFGDAKETGLMYEKAYSKPIGFNDDLTPRLMPNILHTVQKYGNYSFSWAGPRPRVFILDVDVARDAMNKHSSYAKTFKIATDLVKMLFDGGFAILEGKEWSKFRSKVNPFFNMDKLKPLVPAFQLCSADVLKKWNERISKEGGSSVIDVFPDLEIFTGAILAQLMFSSTYTEQIKQTFLQLGELGSLARIHSKLFSIPGEKYLPTQPNRRANEIVNYARASFKSMINDRLQRKAGAPVSGKMDLLDILIEKLYAGEVTKRERHKIIEDAIAECKTFFFAGFETSSTLLTWTIIMLAYHQDWQARAREEVFQVLGDKKDITSDDLGKLKIVAMIINEVLRLYPPVIELSRVVKEESKIKDYVIPKDALVTFPVLMYHRSTKIWGEDAGEFNPQRFADGVLKAANGEAAFMPFGWGPRICIGMNFAILETKTFMSMLLREFSFEFSPTYTHAPVVAFTIQPEKGAPVVMKKL